MEFGEVHKESSLHSSGSWGEIVDKIGYWVAQAGGP